VSVLIYCLRSVVIEPDYSTASNQLFGTVWREFHSDEDWGHPAPS
jgi:hypothetical protein